MSAATGSLVWFRHDLRLADNPALLAAARRGGPIIPVFIWSPEEEGRWQTGAAAKWWLHESLARLDASLRERGSRLIIRRSSALGAIRELVAQSGATAVYWNRRYEPAAIKRDTRVKAALEQDGLVAQSFNGGLLFEPWTVRRQNGQPYQVFSAFWKACLGQPKPALPEDAPVRIASPAEWPASLELIDLGLEPTIDWTGGLRAGWRPGERAASEQLDRFLAGTLFEYSIERDWPDSPGTSRLSPHLHFGEISVRQIWHAIRAQRRDAATREDAEAIRVYLSELGWREFAHHLMYHFPHTPDQPLREEFTAFPWKPNRRNLRAWQRGRTGYPIIDAGMRELWHTGWMHNRVRMVVASFLVKDLLIPWQQGAAWFWDTLVDADLANNTLGWQWTAGCGADAAPYFRIFNPVSQGVKFDPRGGYVRRWIPELARLPNEWIHKPWEAPAGILAGAGIELGRTYPQPIVNHREARGRCARSLRANQEVKPMLFESRPGRAETEHFASKVREQVFLRWDRPAVQIDVTGIRRYAVRNRPHDRLVLDISGQPARRLDQSLVGQALKRTHGEGFPSRISTLNVILGLAAWFGDTHDLRKKMENLSTSAPVVRHQDETLDQGRTPRTEARLAPTRTFEER